MSLRSTVSGQVAQGGCAQTPHVFSCAELKALSQSHSEGHVWAGGEVFYLRWSHDEAGWDPVSDGEQTAWAAGLPCPGKAVPAGLEQDWRTPEGSV